MKGCYAGTDEKVSQEWSAIQFASFTYECMPLTLK